MADETDQMLIRAYARDGCERSFAELVHRYVDLVHSTALRIVREAALAEDVTQRAFLALAQHSTQLQGRSSLTGWLHETSRNLAINTVRGEERRRQREKEATAMSHLQSDQSDALWGQISPFLDDALAELSVVERDLILWRYFERRTAEQIGVRLGLTAEAAQKRLSRALDRLRGIITEKGLTLTAAGLATALSTQAVQSAPVGLAAAAIAAASATKAILPVTSTLQIIMASTKAKFGLAVLLAGTVATPLVLQHHKTSHLLDELAILRQQSPELERLRAEVDRARSEARSASEQRAREGAEVARLRGELATLKARQTNGASLAKSPPTIRSRPKADAPERASEDLVRREAWENVGFQVPSSTVQTLEWAKATGDTNVIANALAWPDERSRAGIEAIFAAAPESVRTKYGSADEYILSLFNHSGPLDDRHTLTSYRIVNENYTGDEALLNMGWNFADGSSHVSPQRYVRIGNDWRQALDFDAPSQSKLSTGLQAEATSEPPDPKAH